MTGRERDLDDELRQFVDELTARNVARGMSPEAARRAALVETGGVQQVRELTREAWFGHAFETLLRDVRYGCRSIARSPGFALVVVATLALVIGANATVFSVMHAVLWRPLPYPEAHRLVVVDADARGVAGYVGIADAEATDLRAEPDLFSQMATMVSVDAHVAVDGEMERVPAVSASNDALTALGAVPLALGRTTEHARDGGLDSSVRSVVISHDLWVRQLKSDPGVIGRHIDVNNLDVEVVGVLRPEFRVFLPSGGGVLPEVVDVWFPRGFENDRQSRGQLAIARLAPGVSLDAARARLDVLARRFVEDHPADYPGGVVRLSIRPVQDVLTAEVRPALWILAAAVGFVLLIGCVNIANLMLARARTRAPEFAVRRALGAGQGRLVRQLFTEAAVLSLIGAACGLALAHAGVAMVDWLRPAHLPRQSTIGVTTDVALFIAVLTVLVSIVFGLLPALGNRANANESLRAGRLAVQRAGMRRMQRGMVIAEVALSIIPLVAAGLMVRTFVNLTNVDVGFDTRNVVTAKVPFHYRSFPEPADRWRLHRAAIDNVRQIPGVVDVSAGGPVPFDDWQTTRTYAREGEALNARATMQSVQPGYLRVTGTRLVAGREFTDDDIVNERPVVVIDERIATQLWPQGAVGQRLAYPRGRGSIALEVIGVSEPVRVTRVSDDAMPHMFIPFHLFAITQGLVIRTAEDPAVIAPAVKAAVESLGTRRPVHDVRPLQSYVDASMGDARFMMLVLMGFGIASVLLAAVGLYGTLAYLTSLRAQEFGIRMALGASAGQVLRAVAGEGLVLAGIGAAIGFAGAAATTGALQGLLYNVTPFDGVTLVGAAAVVALTALMAASHPAWRAAKISPMRVLREGE